MAKSNGSKSKAKPKPKPKRSRSVPQPPPMMLPSLLSEADRASARAAMTKRQRGEKLTTRETAAIRRYDKDRERQLRWLYYRTIPKKDWIALSGRPAKVLNEQAARYGVPLSGDLIDLGQLATWLHNLLAENRNLLAANSKVSFDPLMTGDGSPALERYRTATAKLRECELAERRGQLVKVSVIHNRLMALASVVRGFGEKLERRFGREALDMFLAMLDQAAIHAKEFSDERPEFVPGYDLDPDEAADGQGTGEGTAGEA